MSEFKGTKGNWITFMNDVTKEYSVGGGNDERYFIAKIHTTGRDVETCRANTNLIAAAPELLKACELVKKWLEYGDEFETRIKEVINEVIEKATS